MSAMRFSVEPTHVHVLTRDGFYVTVAGTGIGFLRCQGSRRWVCGVFRARFLLSNPTTTQTQIVVEGRGPAARAKSRYRLTRAQSYVHQQWLETRSLESPSRCRYRVDR